MQAIVIMIVLCVVVNTVVGLYATFLMLPTLLLTASILAKEITKRRDDDLQQQMQEASAREKMFDANRATEEAITQLAKNKGFDVTCTVFIPNQPDSDRNYLFKKENRGRFSVMSFGPQWKLSLQSRNEKTLVSLQELHSEPIEAVRQGIWHIERILSIDWSQPFEPEKDV